MLDVDFLEGNTFMGYSLLEMQHDKEFAEFRETSNSMEKRLKRLKEGVKREPQKRI